MKKILFWGACTLLTTMLYSCTADEDDTITKEIKKEVTPTHADGPGDGTVPPPPPPPQGK
ncbi:hypothetical protein [Flavobacterium sp. N502540]|uniref:hypothetical protein n=1 Tax=Flavobacterium sp. N502540 TaxID=2986838 RepID=UPI0022249743|nr:hypothetical protein [Flavobacterium sp. N502540]